MKTQTLTTVSSLVLVTALLSLASGCAWSIGGSKTDSCNPPTVQPTTGQQLIDLKNAHDQGAISDAEYEKAKQELLNQ